MADDVEMCLCVSVRGFFCLGLFAGNHSGLAHCLIYTKTFMFRKASLKALKGLLEKQPLLVKIIILLDKHLTALLVYLPDLYLSFLPVIKFPDSSSFTDCSFPCQYCLELFLFEGFQFVHLQSLGMDEQAFVWIRAHSYACLTRIFS